MLHTKFAVFRSDVPAVLMVARHGGSVRGGRDGALMQLLHFCCAAAASWIERDVLAFTEATGAGSDDGFYLELNNRQGVARSSFIAQQQSS